jgi:hypothetical protein
MGLKMRLLNHFLLGTFGSGGENRKYCGFRFRISSLFHAHKKVLANVLPFDPE